MFCKYCGKDIQPDAEICIHCGRRLDNRPAASGQDTGNIGWGVLGFFIPLVGLILYLIWKDEKPKTAKVAGKGALIGFIVSIVGGICYGVVFVSMIMNNPDFPYNYTSLFQTIFQSFLG